MEKLVKTANTAKHNFSRKFDKYIKTRSTRSLRAIYRTKRLDIGYFFLDFFPLVRDLFLMTHPCIDERDFEILLQLHANQPFSVDDVRQCIVRRKEYLKDERDWSKKTSLGTRASKDFLGRCRALGIIKLFKNNGRSNKKLWLLNDQWNGDFRKLYDYMLCLSDIRTDNHNVVHPDVRKSTTHLRKIIKQNTYRAKLPAEIDTEIKTTDGEFSIKLSQARAESRNY